jgi:phage tail sheath gpL-like
MKKRRRFTQTELLEHRLADEAARLRAEAKLLPPGILREQVLRQARQCETGSYMSEWLRSPGLQPPKPHTGNE